MNKKMTKNNLTHPTAPIESGGLNEDTTLNLTYRKDGYEMAYDYDVPQEVVNDWIRQAISEKTAKDVKVFSVMMEDSFRSRWVSAAMKIKGYTKTINFSLEMKLQKDGSFVDGDSSFYYNNNKEEEAQTLFDAEPAVIAIDPIAERLISSKVVKFAYGYGVSKSWEKVFNSCVRQKESFAPLALDRAREFWGDECVDDEVSVSFLYSFVVDGQIKGDKIKYGINEHRNNGDHWFELYKASFDKKDKMVDKKEFKYNTDEELHR